MISKAVLLHEKFMSSCEYKKIFTSADEAQQYVEDQIARMQCFYKTLSMKGDFQFQIERSHNMKGDLIVQVFMPVYGTYKVKANLLIIYRIELGYLQEVS